MRGCGSIRQRREYTAAVSGCAVCVLLEECQQDEEADPEKPHRVPVPGDAVDQDLPVFDRSEQVETCEGGKEADDSEREVEGVGPGDDVERVAADVGMEEDALEAKLMPGKHLPGKKK